jgi:hypothetical protein
LGINRTKPGKKRSEKGEKEAKAEGDYDERLDSADAELQTRRFDRHAAAGEKSLSYPKTAIFCEKDAKPRYTYFLERELNKKRILEIYLNVIEWGDGVYGAEAASRTFISTNPLRS